MQKRGGILRRAATDAVIPAAGGPNHQTGIAHGKDSIGLVDADRRMITG